MSSHAGITKNSIIKEVKELPTEMLPEVAKTLTLIKEKYKKTKSPEKIRQLLETHRKVRMLTDVSKVSWSNEVMKERVDRIQVS